MFKKFSNKISNFREILSDRKLLKQKSIQALSLKNIIVFGLVSNVAAMMYFIPKYNEDNYSISVSRYIARKVGQITNVTIPKSIRKTLYGLYIKMYNVNTDEILDKNLENYNNIKEFFIRQIDVIFYLYKFNKINKYQFS
jgi:hypothetical protein